MAEMRRHYKPGDNVIPRIETDDRSDDSEDERILGQTMALSVADLDPAVEANRRSRVNEQRVDRRARQQQTNASPVRDTTSRQQPSAWAAQRARDVEERQVEHQPSLRSLLSASESDSQEVQSEIMQSIMASGVLDGIDIENLTPQQEEALTERIAAEYRRRQRRRDRSHNRDRSSRTDSEAQSGAVNATSDRSAPDAASSQARNRPPISRPHLFEQTLQEPRTRHSRSTSNTSQRSDRSAHRPTEGTTNSAARSATDLTSAQSTEPRTARHGRPSDSSRRVTDPEGQREVIHAERARHSSGPQHRSSVDAARPSAHPLEAVRRQSGATNNSSPSLVTPYPTDRPVPDQSIRPSQSLAAFAPEIVQSQPQPSMTVPAVACKRCGRNEIQYELHYHCAQCDDGNFDLCLSCYRAGQGCKHWFGFGFLAWARWEQALSQEAGRQSVDRPHILMARRFRKTDQPGQGTDPAQLLQAGACCERCFQFTNACYYHCYICLEGAWGYCSSCVNKGWHCTHPLLPVQHVSTLRQGQDATSKANFVFLPHLPEHTYAVLSVQQDCDLCHRGLLPDDTHFHCNTCNDGDYDVCNECYHNLVAQGKISAANGTTGWRRCLKGHRMAIIGSKDAGHTGKQRIVIRESVGGWALKEDEAELAAQQTSPLVPPDGGVGMRCLALWNRFVGDGIGDEISFPKNAEIREEERMNEDWFWGVYAGMTGLFPANHVRVLG
ncbi:hypothetical protein LTR95_007580 [Oleoguttula sp. CCFEE 5521]